MAALDVVGGWIPGRCDGRSWFSGFENTSGLADKIAVLRKHNMKTTARLSVSLFICAALVSSGAVQNPSTRATMAPGAAKAASQPRKIKALAGGTWFDGYGGRPARNSVKTIEGERIRAVARAGPMPVPEDPKLIPPEEMPVRRGLGNMHAHLMNNGHAD